MHDPAQPNQEMSKGNALVKQESRELERAEANRQEADDGLRESELQYRRLLEVTRDLIYITDGKGLLTYLNPALDKTLGYTGGEWQGQPYTLLFAPEYVEAARNIFARAMQGENIPVYETEMISKHGTRIPVEVNITTLYDEEGKFAGRYCIGRDITRRRQAEAALQESELKYRQLIEITRDLIYITDGKGLLTYLNPTLDKTLGYEYQEWHGQAYTLLFAPEYAEAARNIFARAVQGENIPVYETEMISKDGTRIPVEVNITTLCDRQGKFAGRYCIGRDITRRRQAERARRESELKFRRLIEITRDLIYIIDKNGCLTYLNPTLDKTLGYENQEWSGQPFTKIIAPEHVEATKNRFARAMQGETIPAYDTEMLRKDGTRLAVEVNVTTIYDDDGQPAGRYGIGRDITERKKMEMALKESDECFRALFNGSLDGVFIYDFDGKILDLNQAALDKLGYDRNDIASLNFAALLGEEQSLQTIPVIVELLQTGHQQKPAEYKLLCKDGSYLDFEIRSSVVYRDGRPYAIVAISRDITDNKRKEAEILAQAITDQLTGLHNRRGFLSLAGHQLKMAARNKTGVRLFFVDLDGLKWINDTLGHEEGDKALVETAGLLKETFRAADIIGRLGGDEFAILAVDTGKENFDIISTRLQARLDIRNSRGNQRYSLSLSLGYSCYDPDHPCSIEELMAAADKLMYENKQNKKHR